MTTTPGFLLLHRTVRFGETDAACVVHFHHLLRWCHEAWEDSLQKFGLIPGSVFPGGREETPSVALPIVKCHADFYAPVMVGDELMIHLKPNRLDHGSFEVTTQFVYKGEEIARGYLRHVSINTSTRRRCGLPDGVERWLEASSLGRINSH